MTPLGGWAEIPAGVFTMGAEDGPHPEDGEGPMREVRLSAYRIARAAVTVEAFASFVAATGYRTTAERRGAALVFAGRLDDPGAHPSPDPRAPWWRMVPGAFWRRPDGARDAPGAAPVTQVSHADAVAFCAWADVRLPTEAEWERAADWPAGRRPRIWEGRFPDAPTRAPAPDPAGEGQESRFGLIHACGNVWEWTADRFARLHPARPVSDPQGPLNGALRVVKGGSYLCCPSYCARYRPSSRRGEAPGAATCHLGFRIAAT